MILHHPSHPLAVYFNFEVVTLGVSIALFKAVAFRPGLLVNVRAFFRVFLHQLAEFARGVDFEAYVRATHMSWSLDVVSQYCQLSLDLYHRLHYRWGVILRWPLTHTS